MLYKETYRFIKVLEDGTRIMITKERWKRSDKINYSEPSITDVRMKDILDAYEEFRQMME